MYQVVVFFVVIFTSCLSSIGAENDTFSAERMEEFYDIFLDEEQAIVREIYPQHDGSGSQGSGIKPPPPGPPPGPPAPPANPLDPTPKSGYLPIVLSNTTGLDADQVYVILAGKQTTTDSRQYFFRLGKNGVMIPVLASDSTFSVNYSYKLSQLPRSSTGDNDYLIYAPNLNGARFYFSIGKPMYLQSGDGSVTAPTYFAFYDPNYSNLFESVEATFFPRGGGSSPAIPWTASVNTTEVDAFGLPIRIGYYSYSPADPTAFTALVQNPNALPSGFGIDGAVDATTRSGILTAVTDALTDGDETGVDPKVWPRLAVPFYSNPYAATGLQTYLRVLSPKQGLGNSPTTTTGGLTSQHLPSVDGSGAIPPFKNYNYPSFPADYLTSDSYGDADSYGTSLFSFYTGGTTLYLSTGGQTPTVYSGVATGTEGDQVLTFTGVSGPNTGQVNTLSQSDLNTYKMYSGSQLMSGGSDADLLGFYFGDAFIAGFLPSAVGTSEDSPINITDAVVWEPANIGDYFEPVNAVAGGPWFSLYGKSFHDVAVRNTVTTSPTLLNGFGLCYAYDFDDSLGISGTITPTISTANSLNPFLGVTLGEIDTTLPDPYSDSTSYTVTFEFPSSSSLLYRQGDSGAWISVNSGESVASLVSSAANPLQIRYSNGQGPFAYHEFNVFLYYQFLQPISSYNSSELSIINSTTIVPNSATPTAFTINLLP